MTNPLIYLSPSYLRTRPAQSAIQFTVDQGMLKSRVPAPAPAPAASEPAASRATPSISASSSSSTSNALPSPVLTPTLHSTQELPASVSYSPPAAVGPTPAPTPVLPSVETLSTSFATSTISTPASEVSTPATSLASSSTSTPGVEKTAEEIAAENDPEFAAALERQRQRKYEEEKMYCSIENKEACLMCSA